MTRQLATAKRVDLSDLAEGWGGCYALVQPATYKQFSDLQGDAPGGADQKDVSRGYEFILKGIDLAKQNFVSGRVMVLDDSGQLVQDDMVADDIDTNREIANRLISAITGVIRDPKASSTPSPATSSTTEPSPQP